MKARIFDTLLCLVFLCVSCADRAQKRAETPAEVLPNDATSFIEERNDGGSSGTIRPHGSSSTQWFQGGNLHRATVAQWKKASYQNKLATASDWLVAIKWKGHLTSPDDFGRLKLKSQMLVNAVDEVIDGTQVDYLHIAEIATALINLSYEFGP